MSEKDGKINGVNSAFFTSSIFIYTVMLSVGLLVAHFFNENLISAFTIVSSYDMAYLLTIGLLAGIVLAIASHLLEMEFPEYRMLKNILLDIIGQLSVPSIVALSFMSAIGEEVLFRLAIQPEMGIIGTTFVFALMHLGPRGIPNSWTLMSVLISLLLGAIYDVTASVVAVFTAHFLLNLISMLKVRSRYFKKMIKLNKEDELEDPSS